MKTTRTIDNKPTDVAGENNDTAKDDGLGDYVRRIYKIVRADDNGGYEDREDVRSVLKEFRKAYLKEVTDVIVRGSREIGHCDDEVVNNTGSLLLAIHELETAPPKKGNSK